MVTKSERTLELVADLSGHTDKVWHVTFHPTLPLIASCSSDKSIRLWKRSAATGEWSLASVLDDAHKRTVRCVEFSPDGKLLASASFDGTTGVWERVQGGEFECVATLEGHENEVKSVAWSAGATLLATCSRDKSVWIWEVLNDADFACLSVLSSHSADVKSVTFHPTNDLLISTSYDDTVKLWKEDDDDWYCAGSLDGHQGTVWDAKFDSTGNRLVFNIVGFFSVMASYHDRIVYGNLKVTVSDDLSAKFWRRQEKSTEENFDSYRSDELWTLESTVPSLHSRSIYSVSWSTQNNCIATCGGDNCIRILEETITPFFVVTSCTENAHGVCDVNSVCWSKGVLGTEDLLVSGGDDGQVKIWRYRI